jgi:hypothetical protein
MVQSRVNFEGWPPAPRLGQEPLHTGAKKNIMAIDNPIDAYEQQYMKEEPTLPNKLAKYAAEAGFKLAIPDGGLAADVLLKVVEVLFDKPATLERIDALFALVSNEFKNVEKTKASHKDLQKAIQLMFWYDRHERDDEKRAYYVKLIGNAVRSEEQIQDVSSFIQTLEQLNERDLTVLKVINTIMNKDGDWKPQQNPAGGNPIMKLHPGITRDRAQELSVQIAIALGQKTEKNTYSREEGYGICNRLQGFGLAHEVEVQPRELPLTNYAFRLSVQGIRLLKLLGENVLNYDNYFKEY